MPQSHQLNMFSEARFNERKTWERKPDWIERLEFTNSVIQGLAPEKHQWAASVKKIIQSKLCLTKQLFRCVLVLGWTGQQFFLNIIALCGKASEPNIWAFYPKNCPET